MAEFPVVDLSGQSGESLALGVDMSGLPGEPGPPSPDGVSLDRKLRVARTRISEAQRLRAKAESDRASALAAVDAARDALRSEFGVSEDREARDLLAQLNKNLAEAVEAVSAGLDEIGA